MRTFITWRAQRLKLIRTWPEKKKNRSQSKRTLYKSPAINPPVLSDRCWCYSYCWCFSRLCCTHTLQIDRPQPYVLAWSPYSDCHCSVGCGVNSSALCVLNSRNNFMCCPLCWCDLLPWPGIWAWLELGEVTSLVWCWLLHDEDKHHNCSA